MDTQDGVKDMTLNAVALKDEIAKLNALLKEKNEELDALNARILRAFEVMGIDSLKSHGFTFYPETKNSVSVPKTREDKEALFNFLAERGIYWDMVSINSMTLNALYKSLADEAMEKGNLDFRLPGIGEPKTYTTLRMRKN